MLDEKCWRYIFKFLDTESLSKVAQTCHKWYDYAQFPGLWQSVELMLAKALVVDESLQVLGPKLELAKDVSFLSCRRLTADGLISAAPFLKNVETLNIGGVWNTTDAALAKVLVHTPKLKSLFLGGCHLLTDASLVSVAKHCPALEHLSLRFLWNVTPAGITALLHALPSLKSLDVTYIDAVDDAAVEAISVEFRSVELITSS